MENLFYRNGKAVCDERSIIQLYHPYTRERERVANELSSYPKYLYSTVDEYLDTIRPLIIVIDEDIFLFEEKAPRIYAGHFFCRSRGGKALANASSALREIMIKSSVVIGFTPIENTPARWFSRKLGFKSNGLIETAFGEAEFFSMTKQEWNEKYG